MEERQASRQHRVILTNRGTCALNGISDILSFDVNEILLETEMGMLMIRGIDLHVNRLTLEKGEVDLSGKIDSIQYSDVSKGKGSQGESLLGRAGLNNEQCADRTSGAAVWTGGALLAAVCCWCMI